MFKYIASLALNYNSKEWYIVAVQLINWRLKSEKGYYYLKGITVEGHPHVKDGAEISTSYICGMARQGDLLIVRTINTLYHLYLKDFNLFPDVKEVIENEEPNSALSLGGLYACLELLRYREFPEEAARQLEKNYEGTEMEEIINITYRQAKAEQERIKGLKNQLLKELQSGESLLAISGGKQNYFDFFITCLEDGRIEEGAGRLNVSTYHNGTFLIRNASNVEKILNYDIRYFVNPNNRIKFYQTYVAQKNKTFKLINTGQTIMEYEFKTRSNSDIYRLKPGEMHVIDCQDYIDETEKNKLKM